jgi:diguanylate cyclase (GGDEF)-like protein
MTTLPIGGAGDLITALARARETIEQQEREIEALRRALADQDLDELTNLHNRRWLRRFWDALTDPEAEIGAVLFVDVDRLKPINDTYGHKVGDRVIAHVAAALVASGGYAVRLGGDEFLVLLPAGSPWPPEVKSKSIIRDVAEPIPAPGGAITVRVSIGIRIVDPADPAPLWRMITDADQAMYAAKRDENGPGYRVAG